MYEELLFLKENYFDHSQVPAWYEMPVQDEPFVEVWKEYIEDIQHMDFVEALSRRLVQLSFPIQEGMSKNSEYLSATRRGTSTQKMKAATGCEFQDISGIKIYLHKTMAGHIPVIETGNRKDFETLVRVFSHRNEPVTIPASMGACMIKGYNNWDRVSRYREKCGESFSFEHMKTQKELYQDTFLILTDAEYSGVPAHMLNLDTDEWRRLSVIIRREHESTHYFTLRFMGSARNHLLDEFIADYMGIVAAAGKYRADWFMAFMGLENYPKYRTGGRLTNYLQGVELSEEAFEELKKYINNAAENIARYTSLNNNVYSPRGKYDMLLRLSKTNLLELGGI
ncbi:MAG: hypothetical protein PHD40_02175 [Syntrophomonadaceae bacterium]|nr:hypothetical protein [Syntrophomonadaceae bacterium]